MRSKYASLHVYTKHGYPTFIVAKGSCYDISSVHYVITYARTTDALAELILCIVPFKRTETEKDSKRNLANVGIAEWMYWLKKYTNSERTIQSIVLHCQMFI